MAPGISGRRQADTARNEEHATNKPQTSKLQTISQSVHSDDPQGYRLRSRNATLQGRGQVRGLALLVATIYLKLHAGGVAMDSAKRASSKSARYVGWCLPLLVGLVW